jgi:hypothetical protein
MTEEGANPFTEALEEFDSDFSPFEQTSATTASTAQLQTVAEMNLVKPEVLDQLPKIATLTVKDLNDLADAFNGIPTNNPNVAELTLEDLKDIEDVFFEYKLAVGRDMQRPLGGGQGIGVAGVSVSSCCSTPCSCCAAVDMTVS